MLLLNTCRRCLVNQQKLSTPLIKLAGVQRNFSLLGIINPRLQKQNIEFRKSRIKTNVTNEKKDQQICLAYCTSESYGLDDLRQYFAKDSDVYTLGTLPKDATDVLYVKKKNEKEEDQAEIFLFRRLGTFVCWNVSKNEIYKLRQIFKEYELSSYSDKEILEESEIMDYEISIDTPTSLTDGNIYINSSNDSCSQTLEKLAFSNALALSVRLSMWETALDNFSNSMRHIPEHMKEGLKVTMSRREVMQKIGELLTLRHQINLYSDLLITPDFFWDRDHLEKLYVKTCAYLEVSKRTKVMNEKLNLCSELVELLRSHLNEQHSHRLEWMIIVLITIEVFFEITHWADRVFSS